MKYVLCCYKGKKVLNVTAADLPYGYYYIIITLQVRPGNFDGMDPHRSTGQESQEIQRLLDENQKLQQEVEVLLPIIDLWVDLLMENRLRTLPVQLHSFLFSFNKSSARK